MWGGLWGVIFLIPFYDDLYVFKGLMLSLLPTFAAWYIFIPLKMPPNESLGLKSLLLLAVLNAVWGLATVLAENSLKNR